MTWREAHRQHVMELEAAAARVMLTALDGILAQVAAGFAALVADASPAEARGSIDDAAQIRVEWRAAVHDQVLPWFAGVYEAGAEAAQEQVLGLGIVVPDPLPELLDQAAVEYLAQTAPRLYSLGDDAWDAAHAVILAGFQDGEGIDVIRRRIQDVTDLTRHQADALARTEVIGASNMGAQARIDLMGADAPPYKQWLATMDGRTRPTHRHADGQVVPHGQPFEVGAARLQVPGDPAGPNGEVVNCRCTVLYLDTAEPIDPDTPGRGQGGTTPIVDQVAGDVAAAGPDQIDAVTGEPHTGAMLALVPADPEAWTVAQGEPPEAVHLTLCYLGDSEAIPDDAFDALLVGAEALADVMPPVDGRVFGAAVWNATGDTPSMVLSIGGDQLEPMHYGAWLVVLAAMDEAGGWEVPPQHEPWVAHLCLSYFPDPAGSVAQVAAQFEGPIMFDTLRLTRGAEAFDFPLAGSRPDQEDEGMNPEQARNIGQAVAAGVQEALASRSRRTVAPTAVRPVTLRARDSVLARVAAINLAVEPDPPSGNPDEGGPPAQPGEHLRATMHVRGTSTGDGHTGRLFLNTDYRDPPFSFNYQLRSSAHGGLPEVVHIGNVVRVVEDGETLYGFVTLDLDGEQGFEYARRSVAGVERWVSMGLDETRPAKHTLLWPEIEPEDPEDDGTETEAVMPILETIDGGRIGELTGVSVPAQADATIEPTAELLGLFGDPAEEPALVASGGLVRPPVPIPAIGTATGLPCSCGGACGHCGSVDGGPASGVASHAGHGTAQATRGNGPDEPSQADVVQALTAASVTITLDELPPAEWFTEPEAAEMQGAFMINEHGRIWGLLAPLGTGHRAFVRSGRRVEAPVAQVDYDRFMGAKAMTASGLVQAGPLTMNCGHAARLRANHDVAPEHYENSCSVLGNVAVGFSHRLGGAWIAGALLPHTTPDRIARALACRCSGDWQPHPDRPGWQELVAALLVPAPGFASAHSAAASTTYDGDVLVASSVPVRYVPEPDALRPTPLASAVRLFATSAGRTNTRRVLDATRGRP